MGKKELIRKVVFGSLVACVLAASPAFAQKKKHKEYRKVYPNTVDFSNSTQTAMQNDTIFDPLYVATNKFGKDWFLFAMGGVQTFLGDYSGLGDFKGTISPDWGIGLGKWFTSGVALKLEFIHSHSRGYTGYKAGDYGYGDMMESESGIPYRKMKTEWMDLSVSAVLNLTRLFYGYEGYGSKKRMNQLMASFGIGGVYRPEHGEEYDSDNEWSGHAELQYSRFFNPKKRFSLDLKLRGIFYPNNSNREYGQVDNVASKWDANVGVNVGFTFYFDRRKSNSLKRGTLAVYQRDYRKRKTGAVKEKENVVKHHTLTFYAFLPNEVDYRETDFGGLNAHAGLETVRENMNIDKRDRLVSFADMYAAMGTNEGYILQYTDAATVAHIRRIFEQGSITMIQVEGLAATPNNDSEDASGRVGAVQNTTLSQKHASAVISWLQRNPSLRDVSSQIFMVSSLQRPVREVIGPSAQGLSAKLSRCVKVRIHYMMK